MLEKIPSAVGHALSGIRSGLEKITCYAELAALPETIELESPMFGNGELIPRRFTADGQGLSPPLQWSSVPARAAALIILVEDADAPSPKPLVHCIVVDIPPENGSFNEGELKGPAGEGADHRLGENSFMKDEWLPPDPPPGHGLHRYIFQIFALSSRPDFRENPGRGEVVDTARNHGIAKGVLLGTYKRD
jgi:Raf kinase inhibitor-like YbhB/YbcL family protein